MKKIFTSFALAAMTMSAAQAAPANLLQNPTTFDAGWEVWNSGNGSFSVADGVLTLSKTEAQNGDYAKWQNVTLESGKSYTFLVQYRTSGSNTSKSQFVGFWNADAKWASGSYSDLEASEDWKWSVNNYTPGETKKSIMLASNKNNHTVEYKNAWLVETPVLTVKVAGADVEGDLNPGESMTVECSVSGYDIYYVIGDAAPVKYESAVSVPDAASVSVYVDLEGYRLAEKTFTVASTANYRALYDAAKEKYAYVAVDYPLASAEKLSVFTETLGDNATIDDYKAAIAALENISNLRAVVESDALAEANSEAVDMTSLIINPCAAGNTDGWNLVQHDGNGKCASDNREGERPTMADGSRIDTYFDGGASEWGKGDWTNRLEQTITLDKGEYRLAMLGRGSDQCRWMRVIVSDTESNVQTIAEQGDKAEVEGWYKLADVELLGADNGVFGKGWNNYNVDFKVEPADGADSAQVKITVAANAKAGSQWYSFTDFRLTQTLDGLKAGVEGVEAAEDTDAPYYDLQGRRVINPEKGIYIRNGKKIVIR